MQSFANSPSLIIRTKSVAHRLLLVGAKSWTIGRSKGNLIVLPDREVSRNHAELHCTHSGNCILVDLDSRNGSFVNGQRVLAPIMLHNGDRLAFGKTKMEFYDSELPIELGAINLVDLAELEVEEDLPTFGRTKYNF
jgi:adenylate cyclase